jgi:hypothetical protein
MFVGALFTAKGKIGIRSGAFEQVLARYDACQERFFGITYRN